MKTRSISSDQASHFHCEEATVREGTHRPSSFRVLRMLAKVFCSASVVSYVMADGSFTPITTQYGCRGHRISDDGQAVAGHLYSGTNTLAFRWTQANGVQQLQPPNRTDSVAYGISADGGTVVGSARDLFYNNRPVYAYRWTQSGGFEDLSNPSVLYSSASNCSGDGVVVVGTLISNSGDQIGDEAMYWSAATGMINIAPTNDFLQSGAYDVSRDGGVVAGYWRSAAMRWTPSGGMELLGNLGGSLSRATTISGDGLTIAGISQRADGSYHAFRWRQGTGMVDIGDLSGIGDNGGVWGANEDGDVLVGSMPGPGGSGGRAMYWTEQTGMVDMNIAYDNLIPDGWTLSAAQDVTPDGSCVLVWGRSPDGWYQSAILCVPEPGNLMSLAMGFLVCTVRRRRFWP